MQEEWLRIVLGHNPRKPETFTFNLALRRISTPASELTP